MNKIQFYILVIFSLLLSVLFPYVLPERFFLDAGLIVQDPGNEKGWVGSYPLSMLFYAITRLGQLPYSLVALIQLPVLFLCLRLIGIPDKFQIFTIKNILVYLSFIMIAVFIGQPSKEFFTFLFMGFVVLIFQRKRTFYWYVSINKLLFLLFFSALYSDPILLLCPLFRQQYF